MLTNAECLLSSSVLNPLPERSDLHNCFNHSLKRSTAVVIQFEYMWESTSQQQSDVLNGWHEMLLLRCFSLAVVTPKIKYKILQT